MICPDCEGVDVGGGLVGGGQYLSASLSSHSCLVYLWGRDRRVQSLCLL